jgi:hypothetical protein
MSDLPSTVPQHKAGYVLAGIPHAAELTLTVVELKAGEAVCRVPYAEHLIGNPDTPRQQPVMVVDTSAMFEVLLQTPAAEAVEARLFRPGATLHAPHLIDVGVAQVSIAHRASRWPGQL